MRRALLGLVAVLAITTAGLVYSQSAQTVAEVPRIVWPWPPGKSVDCIFTIAVRGVGQARLDIEPVDAILWMDVGFDQSDDPHDLDSTVFKIAVRCPYTGWIGFLVRDGSGWAELDWVWVDCPCPEAENPSIAHSAEPPVAP